MTRSDSRLPVVHSTTLAWARWIALTIASGTLLAILGPFGSYMNGGSTRLFAYWIGAMLLGLVLYGSAYRMVCIRTSADSRKWWLALTVAGLIASVPEALATRVAAYWLWPQLARVELPLSLWFAQTATIGLIAMMGIGFTLHRVTSTRIHAPAAPPSITPLTMPLSGDVLALQMEDHYVRVHRPAGTELILMPLGRAIAAMQAPGLQTHRSWWVASHAVEAVEGNARSMRLRLSNGVVAPVARSAVTRLKAAGWLVDDADYAGSRASTNG
ncbi:LytTR family DNA-binding domain-containing protein [Sphingomonas sp. I4]